MFGWADSENAVKISMFMKCKNYLKSQQTNN